MTSTPSPDPHADAPRRVAVIGTGLMGTSIALASARAGIAVTGWDLDRDLAERAAAGGALRIADDLTHAVEGADLVLVCTPVGAIAPAVAGVLEAAPSAVVSDVGSIKSRVADEVARAVPASSLGRFVPGHPMGGSERSGPEHATASVVDGIIWVVAPTETTDAGAIDRLEAFVQTIGARPVRLTPERHDRLVAFVSHLPQIASTSLMGLAATEEADEPDILLLAAGGFRDLTRLASSNPGLWSEILLANRDQVTRAIDLYVERLRALRGQIDAAEGPDVEATFDRAKRARLRLAAKPQVRAGVAVLQVVVPDRPGALALLTSALADGEVNIEDLQIVHSPEGGRGTVHLTVAAASAADASRVLTAHAFDPIRLA
jgi:prephenate dehydrogenase